MEKFCALFVSLMWILSVDTIDKEGDCGLPIGSSSTGKIVGGYDVGYYKYPWYVGLKRHYDVFCGGTYIGRKFIVTAAHCFQPFFKQVEQGHLTFEEIFTPTFGIYNVCRDETTQKVFPVAKVYVHEKYKKMDPYYDIALIKLKQNPSGYRPCCLPTQSFNSKTRPRECLVSGLGDLIYHAQKATCTMHEARILIYDDDVCRKMLDSQGESGKQMIHAFCAGYLEGGIDACQGDSGGPLIIPGKEGRFELLGLTSFGFDCAKPDVLGIYTDVSHFRDWIKEKMKEQVQNPTISPTRPTTGIQSTQDPEITGEPTTVNWTKYPVTPWQPSTYLIPPLEPMPSEEIEHPPQNGHNVPITIIINIMKKAANEKMKYRRGRNGKPYKHQKKYHRRSKIAKKHKRQN